MKRKIASCYNVRIRAGDYQHIEIVKYAEEEIEFNNESERIEKENLLSSDLQDDLRRSLAIVASKMGRPKEEIIEVEEVISKAIPAWLANDPVPNIANGAKKSMNTAVDKQKSEKDKAEQVAKSVLDTSSAIVEKKEEVKVKIDSTKDRLEEKLEENLGELFEDDKTDKADGVKEIKPVETKEEKKEDDGFDLFDEAGDLFGGK